MQQKTKDILEQLVNSPGAMRKLTIQSSVKTLKGVSESVTKRSVLFVTAGIEFANRKDIKDAIEAGERGEPGPLPYGAWIQAPFVIGHTPKDSGVYTEYIRFYPPSNAQSEHFALAPSVQFYADGQEITRERAMVLCGSNAKERETKSEAYAVAVPNILGLG